MVQALHVLNLIPIMNRDVTDGLRSRPPGRPIGGNQGGLLHAKEMHLMLTLNDNSTIVRSRYDAFNQRDTVKGQALVTDDVKVTNIPFGLEFSGHSGYREYLDTWTTAMPDYKVEIVNVMPGEEWTTVELIGRGTHTGQLARPGSPLPPSQKHMELKFCELLRVRDGQISELRIYFDAATMMRQLRVPQNPMSDRPSHRSH
jgi:steroid delta-isomerase-like uncharacterized protein